MQANEPESGPQKISSTAIYTAAFAIGIAAWSLITPQSFAQTLRLFSASFIESSEHFYLASITLTVFLLLALCTTPWAKIKIGGANAIPEFSTLAWIAMIFTSTSGGGLMGFSVYEPIEHFTNSPFPDNAFYASAEGAIALSIFHWGLHGWVSWGFLAIIIAYFTYNAGQPFGFVGVVRYGLPKRLQSHTDRVIAGIDFIALFSAWFGIATGLALICRQLSGGIVEFWGLGGTPYRFGSYFAVAGTFLFVGVALLGLKKGIERLANINFVLSFAIPIIILFSFNTLEILVTLKDAIFSYLQMIVRFPVDISFADSPEHVEFRRAWPVEFVVWWFSYSVMAGAFLARISYGRSIRSMIIATTVVPVSICILWFGVMGSASLSVLAENPELATGIDFSNMVYKFLAEHPFGSALTVLMLSLSLVFFVTTGASALFVLSEYSMRSTKTPPKWLIIAWGVGLGSILSIAAGAEDLQGIMQLGLAAIIPFSLVFFVLLALAVNGYRNHRIAEAEF